MSTFALGQLDPQSSAQLQSHLDSCATCRQIVEARRASTISLVADARELQTPVLVRAAAIADAEEIPQGVLCETANGELLHGRYQLGAEIARGGMGVVHRATDVLFQREVAVKLLRPRWLEDRDPARQAERQAQALQAFAVEAEITARLQHPGIPPVHELGQLTDGLPFLAMKLVRGKTLHDLLAGRASPQDDLARWLQVLEQTAQAIGFAHSQGILHRDLKPLNIMVGAFGEVQVMDWGLAKVLGGPELPAFESGDAVENERLFVSRVGDVKGTLSYMAPEQARGEIDVLDARADVFGLGAILCQILTGSPPYAGNSRSELHRAAAAGDLTGAIDRMRRSGADPEIVDLAIRCLSPNQQARPANGTEVASAIAAHRDGIEQRLRRAETERALSQQRLIDEARRRPLWYGIAGALTLLLCVAGGFAIYYAHANTVIADRETKANNAKQLAETRERDAKQAERDAKQAALREAAAAQLAKERETKAILESATSTAVVSFLEDDLLAFASPDEQASAGVEVTPDLKVRDLMVRAAKRIDGKFRDQPLVEMRLRSTIGRSLAQVGSNTDAIEQFARAYELAKEHPSDEDPHGLSALSNLAMNYRQAGQLDKALPMFEEAYRLSQEKLGPHDPQSLRRAAYLANAYETGGDFDRAIELLTETLQLQTEKLGADHADTLFTRISLAKVHSQTRRFDKSLPILQETAKQLQEKLGREHPDTLRVMADLANVYSAIGDKERALAINERVHELQQAKLGEDHPETMLTLGNVANNHMDLGHYKIALPLFEKTVELMKGRFGLKHPSTAGNMANLGSALHEVGRDREALPICLEAWQLQRELIGAEHPLTVGSLVNVAVVHYALEQYDKAIPIFQEAVQIRTKTLGAKHRSTCDVTGKLAMTHLENGEPEKARDLYQELLKIRLETLGPQHPDTVFNRGYLAMIQVQLKEYDAAEENLLAAWEAGKSLPPGLRPQVLFATAGELTSLYRATGKKEEEAKWLEEVKKLPDPKRRRK